MFEHADSPFPIPEDLGSVGARAWAHIAATGTWWTGGDRVALAEAARAARIGAPLPESDLPEEAVEVAVMIGRTPARTTRRWVDAALGMSAFPHARLGDE